MTERLASVKCFLFDMDGTIHLGNQLLPGVLEFFHHLDQIRFPYFILTNNSSLSRADHAKKLERFGLRTPADKIITSGEATAIFLSKKKPNARIFLVGTPSLEQEFLRYGLTFTNNDPDYVVLGFDTTLTYEKLDKLCTFVRAGYPYIATHPDVNCPTEAGFIPDIGAMMALVSASTGREADVIIGKPHKPIVQAIMQKTGFPANEILMVGDRLYTDIALGKWGLTTVLVLSGEATLEDVENAPRKPDYIVQDVADLHTRLVQAKNSNF